MTTMMANIVVIATYGAGGGDVDGDDDDDDDDGGDDDDVDDDDDDCYFHRSAPFARRGGMATCLIPKLQTRTDAVKIGWCSHDLSPHYVHKLSSLPRM